MRVHSSETHEHGEDTALPWGEEEARELITRRRFLGYLSGLLSAVIAAALALPLVRFYIGNAFQAKPARWLKLGLTREITPGRPKLYRISYPDQDGWRETVTRQDVYAVTPDGRDYIVLSNICTHLGCPIHWDDKVQQFLCPCHGGVFSAEGKVLKGPPPKPLIQMTHKIEGGALYVQAGGA
jgi:menaquinol-cytochrome c reductase iron-sulfur subunit